VEIPHLALTPTHKITNTWNTFIFPAMGDIYNSPFTHGPGPYYIPAHNPNYIQAPDYIHPDSVAGQLGLTPVEFSPILQEQQELM
jgi:hypothetical protein